MLSSILSLALLAIPCLATITPDNTCGGKNGYTCSPNGVYGQGGACCSQGGYCGKTPDYCASGCQSAFGQCYSTSSSATHSGSSYSVSGLGGFTNFANYTFNAGLPSGLTYQVENDGSSPYTYSYVSADVTFSGGYANLKVPGGQTTHPIKSAGIITNINNIKYASVRTYAILANVPGTCSGFFMYHNDTNEIDIEWLSDSTSESNPGDGTRPLHFTNQPNTPATYTEGNLTSPDGVTVSTLFTQPHEYRVDWLSGKTMFYFDGVLQATFTKNVPMVGGYWIWQNWANGDPGWTVGPPKTDSVLRISNIVMYYNTTS